MKKWQVITILVIFILLLVGVVLYDYQQDQDVVFDNNYLAVFRTESENRVSSTYLFVKEDKKGKKKYQYMNTISTLSGYDSFAWTEEITKKGTLKKKKDIYKKAKKHGAYSYVLYEDRKVYSIDEFKKMFS